MLSVAKEEGEAIGLKKGRAEGLEKGRAEGEAERERLKAEKECAEAETKRAEAEKERAEAEHTAKMVAIAKNLLSKGMSIEDVSDSTGLSEEEIKRLINR
jgi:predicted transposase YdaD